LHEITEGRMKDKPQQRGEEWRWRDGDTEKGCQTPVVQQKTTDEDDDDDETKTESRHTGYRTLKIVQKCIWIATFLGRKLKIKSTRRILIYCIITVIRNTPTVWYGMV